MYRLRQDHRRGSARRAARDRAGPHSQMTERPRLAPRSMITARVGESVQRPDAVLKVNGDFPYSSDLQVKGMLYGVTVRSPHPYALIVSIDTPVALASPGLSAVLTHR